MRACSMRTALTTAAGCWCPPRHIVDMAAPADGCVVIRMRCWCGDVAEWRSPAPARARRRARSDGVDRRAQCPPRLPSEAARTSPPACGSRPTAPTSRRPDQPARAGIVVVDARTPDGVRGRPRSGCAQPAARRRSTRCRPGDLPRDAVLVTYCWGPHCNGATQAAARLAALGFSVKEMLGGVAGWRAEGYPFEAVRQAGRSRQNARNRAAARVQCRADPCVPGPEAGTFRTSAVVGPWRPVPKRLARVAARTDRPPTPGDPSMFSVAPVMAGHRSDPRPGPGRRPAGTPAPTSCASSRESARPRRLRARTASARPVASCGCSDCSSGTPASSRTRTTQRSRPASRRAAGRPRRPSRRR